MVKAYSEGAAGLSLKPLKLFSWLVTSATESFLFEMADPAFGWKSEVMLNCSLAIVMRDVAYSLFLRRSMFERYTRWLTQQVKVLLR